MGDFGSGQPLNEAFIDGIDLGCNLRYGHVSALCDQFGMRVHDSSDKVYLLTYILLLYGMKLKKVYEMSR